MRASTEDQFADRAKEILEQFVQERGHKIASYYRENISGTKLDRPELGRLLMDSHHNDILLVEQIDRLTRLSNSYRMTLKKQLEQHELRIVSLDVPTSWQTLSDKDLSQADPITRDLRTGKQAGQDSLGAYDATTDVHVVSLYSNKLFKQSLIWFCEY